MFSPLRERRIATEAEKAHSAIYRKLVWVDRDPAVAADSGHKM
jgi:hypothetical protein